MEDLVFQHHGSCLTSILLQSKFMASAIFLRAVNVGGHQKFQPSVLARDLAEFDVVNIGAAGTFAVRKNVSATRMRKEILARLSFEPQLIICRGAEIFSLANAATELFGTQPKGDDVRKMVSILEKADAKSLPLPFDGPAGNDWQVRLVALQDHFALSWWRPDRKRLVYPNQVVEKQLGISATTRSWNTIESICSALK